MIIDAHLHVFLSASQDPERTVDHIAPAERQAPVEVLNQQMALAGVQGAVLVPLGPEDTYVSSLLAANPNRFAGIAVAEPGQNDPAQVADRLDRGGFKGLRMFALPGDWDDAPWRGLLERLQQDERVLWLYPRAEDIANVTTVAARLEGLRIVLNHCGLTQAGIGLDDKGRPRLETPIPQATESAILELGSFENVFVILSGAYGFTHLPYPYADIGSIVGRLFASFGAARLMWGSDFPWIIEDPGYSQCLDLVDHHLPGLSSTERSAILGSTCREVFDWPEV